MTATGSRTTGAGWWVALVTAALAAAACTSPAMAQGEASAARAAGSSDVDPNLLQALEWRNVGPFRGGRATAVAGVPSKPFTFYMGATGGGVWRTSDGGESWRNISDGWFETGSVGAVTVAPSDPNVVYVGMGEACVRGVTTSHGDGVYKSTDGGETWTHLGLEDTRHISDVRVHPGDPDVVYVGAQGSPWGAHPERGVYRSVDGGETWERVLHVNEDAGVNALVMDPENPRVLYAAMWQHRRRPWHGYELSGGGPGSGLYRSSDGGDSWTRLTRGLPDRAAKFGVSVSPADSDRVYALVRAEPETSGLYRSDDGGDTWRMVNDAHVLTERSAYYMHVVADTRDRDEVWVLNAPLLKSIDGGESFSRVDAPHGDHHDLWIHPENSDWMVEANDGGVNVSHDGGESWSTQGNQPTAQFYRVITDDEFPYHLYGGQQDNTTVKIKSRTFGGGIGPSDWYPVGGGESAHVAFDRDDPALVYAGNYQGQITEFDDRTGRTRNVMRYPMRTAFRPGDQYPYRFNWNAPIVVSEHDPGVIYHGAQMVLKSTDGGDSWEEISPDLTRDEPERQGVVEGDFTFHGTAGEMYNTIFYIAESPHAAGELWVGTDDGRVHLTRNEGEDWEEITPEGLPESQINMIEVSPHRPGKAWVVATRYKFGDFAPRVYRTEDFGASWTRVVEGIPDGDFVRVVREDVEREGLLFAGTETSLYVSFDDGASWQPMQVATEGSTEGRLPRVPVTDLRVREHDLVAATQGRAFWILDDIAPLRHVDEAADRDGPFLFEPTPTERVQGGRGGDGSGENPPTGSVIYYALDEEPATSDLRLEILDPDGEVVNTFTPEAEEASERGIAAWAGPVRRGPALPTDVGLNRFVWDWRVAPIDGYPELSDYRGSRAYRVAPGRYRVRLTVGDRVATRPLEVLPDPRVDVSPGDREQKQALLAGIYADVEELQEAAEELKYIRTRVRHLTGLAEESAGGEIVEAGRALDGEIGAWLDAVVEEGDERFIDALHSPARLDFNLLWALGEVDEMDPPVTAGMAERVEDLRREWERRRAEYEQIVEEDLPAFNAVAEDHGTPPVTPPSGVAGKESGSRRMDAQRE